MTMVNDRRVSAGAGHQAVLKDSSSAPVVGDAFGELGMNEFCSGREPIALLAPDDDAFEGTVSVGTCSGLDQGAEGGEVRVAGEEPGDGRQPEVTGERIATLRRPKAILVPVVDIENKKPVGKEVVLD